MRKVALSNGGVALVDNADFDRVTRYTWRSFKPRNVTYAVTQVSRSLRKDRYLRMHNLILGVTGVDHRNGNGLDNRRSNLRTASRSQNGANAGARGGASRFKGVSRYRDRWRAYIRVNGRQLHLGCYNDEEDAARAYDLAAHEHFGEFARLNFEGPE